MQCVQRVQHADDARPGDNNRVDIAVFRPHAVRYAQQNQHNRNRIDGVQNRDGNAQNDRQTQIANQEGKANNEKDPLAVADAGEKVREILRDGVNQPDTRRQAGEREDGGEQIRAGFAEELEDDAPQRPRAVLLNVVHAGGAHAHVAEHHVDGGENQSGEKPSLNRVVQYILALRQPEAAQRRGNH